VRPVGPARSGSQPGGALCTAPPGHPHPQAAPPLRTADSFRTTSIPPAGMSRCRCRPGRSQRRSSVCSGRDRE